MSVSPEARIPALSALLAITTLLTAILAACDNSRATDLERLAQLVVEGQTSSIEYNLSSTFGGKPVGVWTVQQRDPDFRMDLETGGFVSTTILAGGEGVACSGAGGVGTCFPATPEEVDAQKSALGTAFDVPAAIADDIDNFEVTSSEVRDIAGETADCYSLTSDQVGLVLHEGEICFAEDGLLLKLDVKVSATDIEREFSIEATQVSREVPDGAFEPPYPVAGAPGPSATPEADG